MSWNLLNFPSQSNLVADTTMRLPCYRTVVHYVNPDIVVTQENSASNSISFFLDHVLNDSANVFSAGAFINGYDTDNGIFYRTSCFHFVSNVAVQTALRDVNQFTLVHMATGDTIRIYSCHLKASSGAANEALRAAEADSIRKVTDALTPGSDFLICGDFNFYGSFEAAYQRLLAIDSAGDGNFIDPISMSGTWNNASYSMYHTQSTRTRSFGGGATGGLDDRFDLMLYSTAVSEPGRITYETGTMTPVGNDGLHYGDSISRPPNAAVPQNVAEALHCGADHLPVFADFIFAPVIGIEEASITKNRLEVFPNPSDGNVSVRCEFLRAASVTISIFDQWSREIKTIQPGKLNSGSFEQSIVSQGELKPGIYFVRLATAGGESFSALFSIQ